MTREVMVAVLMPGALKPCPSTTTNVNKMAESPTNHDPSEMQISFMGV
ncbi:MAG: hypothetical protein ACREA9_15450 [Pyrinomonadaceae bacterium]